MFVGNSLNPGLMISLQILQRIRTIDLNAVTGCEWYNDYLQIENGVVVFRIVCRTQKNITDMFFLSAVYPFSREKNDFLYDSH